MNDNNTEDIDYFSKIEQKAEKSRLEKKEREK